ncbi:hypothetical protein WR25_16386 [Diploscapter pachys]|uniref:Phlebovirus glycoprotein G2 fusion domain-containing protein n=1 Tax=Diploscapter pachys TaxID=2018661 RepID=A0A2A2K8C9_9BILA|nr:hypothetical protein WR25_16386 [Diploscapter pachys]
MCLDNLLNPTCWPWGNIFMYAFILLMAILGLYLVCTQPVVIGDVIRFVGSIFLRIAKAPWRIFWCGFKGSRVASKWISRKCRRNRRKEEVEEELIEATLSEIVVRPAREGGAKPRNLKFALNMAIIMTLITSSMSCVEINLMDRQHVNCMEMPGDYEKCTVQFQSELHIDWLQWHGCVVAKYNNTKIAEVRLAWENSTSSCLPETKGFTRNVVESRELSTECFSECPANEDLIEGLATTTTELHPQAEVVAKCRMNLCETVRDLFAVSHLINWPKGREIGTYTISPSDDQIYAVEQCQSWSTEAHSVF